MTRTVDHPDRIEMGELLTTPFDVAVKRILGDDYLGGTSGPGGWSARKMFQVCPYLYLMNYVASETVCNTIRKPSRALGIGSLFHLLLALKYEAMIEPNPPFDDSERNWLRTSLLAEKVSGEVVAEGFRLFQYYEACYDGEDLQPLAVEQRHEHDGVSCRYDLIARREDAVWIVEHKTSASNDFGAREGWRNDGGVLTQLHVWDACKLDEVYGELAGILVNVITKASVPEMFRVPIPRIHARMAEHLSDLRFHEAERDMMRASGFWPRRRASCLGRFGPCELWDHCTEA